VRTRKTIAEDTTEYVLDLAATLPVVISDTEAVYLYGLDIIAQHQSETLYYVHDGLGSARQLVDSTGQIETNYAYDPFGVPLLGGEVYNPYQYTGEAWDAEVELVYLRARYYQPKVGRFIAKDPWPGDVWRPGTLNRYQYVTNNPITRVDPAGRQEVQPTPEPTDRQRQVMQCIQDMQQPSRLPGPLVPASCEIPVAPQQESLPVFSGGHPGIGLVFQRTIVSPERSVTFWAMYYEFYPEVGFVPAVAGGEVRHGVELTVEVYLNGTYVDIRDSYNLEDLGGLQYALDFPPTLARTVQVATNRSVGRPLLLRDQYRLRERWGFGNPVEAVDPREGLPSQGMKGQSWPVGDWFTAGDGRPSSAYINLIIPELAGGMPCASVSYSPERRSPWVTYGPVHSYEVHFGHIYPSH
jgi:RHS repeat-associated protein